ncbi:MAG: class I SAM-dependent methyltransferase [Proteobacteria bacterium]|nr:class I SAM-dependent methyltransferase [Pseudomonadota bacterium]
MEQERSRGVAESMSEFDRFASSYKSALDRTIAFSGESSEYFAHYKAAYIDRALGRSGSRKILDFGCGVGLLASALAKLRPQDCIHGFDVSADSLGQVEEGLRSRGLFTADLGELDHDYDLIAVSNVMHHLPVAERQGTIQELAARLARNGMLLVIEHNPLNPLTRWIVAHCDFDDDAILLWPSEVKQHFAGAGLTAMRCDYILFFPRMLSRMRGIEPRLTWCPAGAQFALSARKG